MPVAVLNPANYLLKKVECLCLIQSASLDQVVKQLSSLDLLQNQISKKQTT